MMIQRTIHFTFRISVLLFVVQTASFGQYGTNSTRIEHPIIHFEHVWSTQLDPRWEPGANIGNEDDGITSEFVEFSTDGRYLVTANGLGEAFILDTDQGNIVHTFRYISEQDIASIEAFDISGGRTKGLEVECGAFIPGTDFLVLGGNLNGVKFFDLSSNHLAKHLTVEEEVDGLGISDDGRFFAHAAPRGVQVLAIPDWTPVAYVQHGSEEGVVNSIDFSSNGRLMASAGNYGRAVLNQTSDWQPLGERAVDQPSSIKSVRFSPDDTFIAAGYSGGSVAVFQTRDLALVAEMPLFYIEAVAWSSDGQFLMAGGRDNEGRLRIFTRNHWDMVADPEVQADHSNIEYIDVFGALVAVAGEDGHVRLFRMSKK